MSSLRIRVLAALVFLSSASPAVSLGAQSQQAATRATDRRAFPPDSAVLAIIKQRVEEKRSAGIVVGMLEPNGRTRIVAFGDPGPGQPALDGNSVFEIGSITKVFTGTVLAQMVQEGKVKLEDPVQKYLPSSVKVPTRNGKQITLGNLSVQNSGLPRMPSNFRPANPSNPYADYSAEQMYEFLSGYQLTRDPGERFEYSNLGVGLLGHVLALRDGKSYEQMIRDRILAPLGMTRTAITFTPWMKEHLALGHDEQGNVAANWDLTALAGAGALRSTTVDMLKFIDANLHPERGALQRAMAFAHQARGSAGGPGSMIGLNWVIQHIGSDSVIVHNGGTGGYRTFAGFDPASRMGVVIMTNSTGEGADDIGMHLLNSAAPLAPKPQPMARGAIVEVPASVLETYVGKYELAPGLVLDVTLSEGALFVEPTNQAKLRLWAESETTFFLREADVKVTFVKDASGKVTQIMVHQGGQSTPAKRIN